MTEQTAPILGQVLPLRRGGIKSGSAAPGSAPVPPGTEGDTTQGDTAPIPVPPGTEVVPLSSRERGSAALRHWASTAANGAGQLWLNPGRAGHSLYHGKPGSLAEHRAYMKSRAWVPPELDGKPAAVVAGTGIVYHLLIARPVKAVCLTVSASADRPLRLFGLAVFLLVFFTAVLPHIPLPI